VNVVIVVNVPHTLSISLQSRESPTEVFVFKVPKQYLNPLETLENYLIPVTTFALQLPFVLASEEMEFSTEAFSCNTSEPPLAGDSPLDDEIIPVHFRLSTLSLVCPPSFASIYAT
jgi:hypothetical protein